MRLSQSATLRPARFIIGECGADRHQQTSGTQNSMKSFRLVARELRVTGVLCSL